MNDCLTKLPRRNIQTPIIRGNEEG